MAKKPMVKTSIGKTTTAKKTKTYKAPSMPKVKGSKAPEMPTMPKGAKAKPIMSISIIPIGKPSKTGKTIKKGGKK